MVVRLSHLTVALLIAATQLSPIEPTLVITAGVDQLPGNLLADTTCFGQLESVTRLDVSIAIFCLYAFVLFARRIVDTALPGAAMGLVSSSLLAFAGLCFALVGCLQTFGWHPCSEIVGVGGICGAAAILFVFAGALAKCWLTGAWGRREPRDDRYEIASPVHRRGPA
jgi:hypothetical protein